MEEKVKEIVSVFIKVPAEQIAVATSIDRNAVNSSIMLHRMYAKLSEQGFVVQDYSIIKNFGGLISALNENENTNSFKNDEVNNAPLHETTEQNSSGIGIDIEEVSAMPRTNDFREDEFYKMNFSSSEIAYCILQRDPYASFAGLFAAKEAIVKANNKFGKNNFNNISIDHSLDGKPIHPSFQLSISHTNNMTVAVAIENRVSTTSDMPTGLNAIPVSKSNSSMFVLIIALLAFLISIASLFLVIKR